MREQVVHVCGRAQTLSCDGRCEKAWGVSQRPSRALAEDEPDDVEYLADGELGTAPEHPGTWEGGDTKPAPGHPMNRWCLRECERSVRALPGVTPVLPGWATPVLNQPWKHA